MYSFDVVAVKDAFKVESVVVILFLWLDVRRNKLHRRPGRQGGRNRPYRNVASCNQTWKTFALLLGYR